MTPIRNPLTDNHGNYDIANIGVAVAVAGIVGLGYFQEIQGHPVNLQDLGLGIAAIIVALGGYRWGDSKSPRPPRE